MTKTSTMMGSPFFMSPEQMRSAKDVDARSDVWSMGVVLYQLLTARLPFEADTLGGIMAAVLQDDPSMLSTYRPDVPHAFEAIVRRCLQRDRNARAQNVGEIAMTLAPYAPRARQGDRRPGRRAGRLRDGPRHADHDVAPRGATGSTTGSARPEPAVSGSGRSLGAAVTARPGFGRSRRRGSRPALRSSRAAPAGRGGPRPRGARRRGRGGGLLWYRGAHRHRGPSPQRQASAIEAPAAPPSVTVTSMDTATVTEAPTVSAAASSVPTAAATAAPEAKAPVTARGGRPAPPRPPAATGAAPPPPGPKKSVLDDRN